MGADGKISPTVRGLDTYSSCRQAFRRVLKRVAAHDILVRMTRIKKNLTGRWPLQDAKAHFSELVRRVRSDGPQLVTVHGRDEVVVVAVEEFRRLKGDRTGAALIAALQESPYRDIDLEPRRERLPVRDVKL
jgi:prevent-host-death family protein